MVAKKEIIEKKIKELKTDAIWQGVGYGVLIFVLVVMGFAFSCFFCFFILFFIIIMVIITSSSQKKRLDDLQDKLEGI